MSCAGAPAHACPDDAHALVEAEQDAADVFEDLQRRNERVMGSTVWRVPMRTASGSARAEPDPAQGEPTPPV